MPEDFRTHYNRLLPDYERLCDEVVFSLTDALKEANVRTHAIPARVKTAQSLATKALDKGWIEPFDVATDIVGARVVVLFKSDIEPARKVIHNLFNVVKEENVGTAEPARFGYSGVHFDAFIPESDSGRRYRGLHELKFEIQLRTIVEDAWAAVSHVLGYKGTTSIPEHLQRDFHALSGLFYVADQHFEMFYKQAAEASHQAEKQIVRRASTVRRLQPLSLNADTLAALVNNRYPDREPASRADGSELLPELLAHGLTTTEEVAELLDKTQELFVSYEMISPPGDFGQGRYAAIGVARVSLALASEDYRRMRRTEEERQAGYVDDMHGLASDFLNIAED
jgi:putative GTP pyrophosphokinase